MKKCGLKNVASVSVLGSAEIIIESVEKLGGMYMDCHGENIVPCQRPVGHNEDFDFAVVDASGLLSLNSGKGGQRRARQHFDGFLGMYIHLQDQLYKDELGKTVQKVRAAGICFSTGSDFGQSFAQTVRVVKEYAWACFQVTNPSHQPDSSVQDTVERWPPLPNATVRAPMGVGEGSSRTSQTMR